MEEYEAQVLECHRAMELAINERCSIPLLELRQRLLKEEMEELNIEIEPLGRT